MVPHHLPDLARRRYPNLSDTDRPTTLEMTADQRNRQDGIVAALATLLVTAALALAIHSLVSPAAAPVDGPLLIHTDCSSTLPTEAQP